MRPRALLLATLLPLPASAQAMPDATASPASDRSVTIYRAPGRNGGSLALDNLHGFAVITETRTVTLPAGESRLRFTGVADGIVPESAIVSGLPGGVIEKNRDAALLSPSALARATVNRDLTLTRTDRRTGKTTTTAARLISASEDGMIFATAQGNEALRCSGLPETVRFTGGTEGLSAQPTLSVRTRTARPVQARVTLTYIAENFDWNAHYIATIAPDGQTLTLAGWITLANGNGQTLTAARTQVVAGGLNRAYLQRYINAQPKVVARCWPMQNTSQIPEKPGRPYQLVQPWLGEQPGYAGGLADIVVTAQRRSERFQAVPMAVSAAPPPMPAVEQLGDLKLYRVPLPTDIQARQMKQTRLLDRAGVRFEALHRAELALAPWQTTGNPQPATLTLRLVNDKTHGLGLALPAGAVVVEQQQSAQPMLLGEPDLHDTAEDEKIELELGPSPDVTVTCRHVAGTHNRATYAATLANASPRPAIAELRLPIPDGWTLARTTTPAPKVDGTPTVRLTLPPGSSQRLELTLTRS